jgi:hypothetical protein
MRSQIGCVTVPAETLGKLYKGVALNRGEQTMVDRMPAVIEKCLVNIPRIESVREIRRQSAMQFVQAKYRAVAAPAGDMPWGARALRIALDFDRPHKIARPHSASCVTICTSTAGASFKNLLIAFMYKSFRHPSVADLPKITCVICFSRTNCAIASATL